MDILIQILSASGVFIVGLLARLVVAMLIFALLALPLLAVVLGVRGLETLWQQIGGVVSVDGLRWKAGLYYAPGHTWVKRGWAEARVGLDGVAQRIVFGARAVELPQPGTRVHAGEAVSCITCGDKRAAILSPVDGVVTTVNEALRRNPSALHQDPYAEGWLFDVMPVNFRYTCLRRGRSALRWFREEAALLRELLDRELGLATADGGELVVATPALLSDAQWTALVESFLCTKTTGTEVVSENRAEAGTSAPRRFVVLLQAVGGAVVGGLYVLFFPIIAFAMLIGVCSARLWQLLRSGAARVAAKKGTGPGFHQSGSGKGSR